MTTQVVPIISSGTAGPLGAIHLPRMWAKLTLDAAGKLPADYDACGSGFDQLTIDDLGLKREAVIEYIKTKRPTYVEFEEWVVANGKTDPETIRQHNEKVRNYKHGDDTVKEIRGATGLKRDDIRDAVTLNTLEDLHTLHSSARN
ncbi:MAG: DUF5069 domain-containing protein [Candidatus Eremiobacteraeota bacterium]|nr:DUF5069 domain-containing protein [Candidatus Eremiobacteraeota bacterium]MBV8367251.1 DUF5069 domain-containing protein [Candidatus Eremiobacteraeota bacterium]